MTRCILILTAGILLFSCITKREQKYEMKQPQDFDPAILSSDMKALSEVRGQLLYLPVYSNIPYLIDTGMFDMSAFVAIHNTDLLTSIRIIRVLYFNEAGQLVDDFTKDGETILKPLATSNFYIPYEDKSGNGANFLIEWKADTLVTEPLIEAITLCLKPNNTLAILSKGKVVRQE
jgi:hypothetical protein